MLLFIVNPAASSGNGRKIWKSLQIKMMDQNIAYEYRILKKPGDATQIAARLCKDKKPYTIVLVGGDGTINEFLTGISDASHLTLAVIPTGSGNDFAKGLALPDDPAVCLDQILKHEDRQELDIGVVTEPDDGNAAFGHASFGVSSGIGFDAAVCYEASRGRFKTFLNRIRLGKLIYLLTALRLPATIRSIKMTLILDDGQPMTFEKTWFAAAMNTIFEGGGFMFCPEADPCDGNLDIIVAEGISRLRVLITLPSSFSGKHVDKKGIHIFRCKKAEVTVSERSCVHTDGEHCGFSKKITWSLRNEGLQVIRCHK